MAARAVLDEHALHALAGNAGDGVLVDLRDLRVPGARKLGGAAGRLVLGLHGARTQEQRGREHADRRSHGGPPAIAAAIAAQCVRRCATPSASVVSPRRASPMGTSEKRSTLPPK